MIRLIRRLLSKNTERFVLFIGGVLISSAASGLLENTLTWSEGMLIGAVVIIMIASLFLFADTRTCIQDLSDKIEANVRNRSYVEQADMYRDLAKYIDDKGVRKAVLIQYSSASATNLLRKLISKNAHVILYVKSLDNAVSDMQKNRIKNTIQQLHGVIQGSKRYRLVVYEYDTPASIRAVKIDDEVIAIGWYTYEHMLTSDTNYPGDNFEISGHDVAGMLLFRGSPEYDTLNKMFENQIRDYEQYIKVKTKDPLLRLP